MEKTKEYFCWVRAVARGGSDIGTQQSATPDGAERGAGLIDEDAVAQMRMTCPEVTWIVRPFDKWPPAQQVRTQFAGPFEKKTGALLHAEHMTTVHLEQPVAPLELDIDMRPIFGARAEAFRWIESEAGKRFCDDAKALSLICFTVIGER